MGLEASGYSGRCLPGCGHDRYDDPVSKSFFRTSKKQPSGCFFFLSGFGFGAIVRFSYGGIRGSADKMVGKLWAMMVFQRKGASVLAGRAADGGSNFANGS